MKFYNTTLANGLTLIGERRDSAVSAAIGFFVKTGARDEAAGIAGVSHFLEHMMFKGTAKRSALDITYEMGAMGAQSNAFTSEESTVYYMAVLPEYFSRAVELLADMLRPALDEKEFEVEKKVILEEIALYQDRPSYLLFETAMREFFAGHPAGNSVLGSVQSVGALLQTQMKSYFDARYSPANMVFAASGNFDWQEFVDLAGRYCAAWPKVSAGRDCPGHLPVECAKVITKAQVQQAHLCLMGPGPAAQDSERYPAEVLSCILGDSAGSRVYWDLIDKGLADAASVDCDDMDGTGMVYGYVSSTPEQIDQVGDILRGIMLTPREFSDAELQRAVTKLGTRLVLQGESSMRRLMAIGNDWLYREEYVPLADELKRVQAVSRKEINSMLDRFSFAPTASVKLLPEGAAG